MPQSYYRKFIGSVVAASIALTALGASPAFADRDDELRRALATLLGVAVVGALIHDNKKKKRAHREVAHPHQPSHPPQRVKPRHRPYTAPHVDPRPLPRRVRRGLLPQNCLRSFHTHDGRVRMFPRRCLERHYGFVHQLPRQCATRIHTDRGRRVGWEAHCLRQQGYRLAHR